MPSGTLRAPLESMASQFTVTEIDAQGSVTLQPHLSAQEEMAQQIGQLWDTYNNFQGLPDLPDTSSDIDNDTESKASDEEDSADLLTTTAVNGKSDEKRGADMDAYAVRAKVHEQLTLAQSEIQVSLDMVRLLLAAKKRAARGGVSGEQAALAKHDQATGSTAFAALVGGDIGTEVTVGGLPFPVGMVDTVKTERRAQTSSEQQTNELKFVLGAKYRQMGEAADTLLLSSQRLQTMARAESGFWHTAFELRRRNWVVQQQRQLMGASSKRMPLYGDRYFVRYGYADAGSSFSEDGLAEILRPSDDGPLADDSDVVMQSPPSESVASQLSPLKQGVKTAPLFIPSSDRRRMQVRLFSDEQNAPPGLADSSDYCGSPLHPSALDRTHARLLGARRALFDRELYHRLCKEARVLDLGSVRSTVTSADPPLIRDILVTTLSRDNMDVRFEWMLDDSVSSECPGSEFVAWQSEYYAGLALVIAAMHQRRLHREVKQHYLGANLASRAHVTATSGRAPLPPPDAFANAPVAPTSAPPLTVPSQVATGAATPSGVSAAPSSSETAAGGSGSGSPAAAAVIAGSAESSTAAEATGAGTTYSVARSDLLILAPVLQGMRFAKWQHILSAHTQRACAAWRQLTGEPIEVITHFARSYQTPDGEWSARDTRSLRQLYTPSTDDDGASSEGMAYVIRMRFQGGSIMAFRVDSLGNLVFIKGYFPPSTDSALSQPDQISIHRVFRIIPMAGLSEFVDQLRREMQSLVLLRVASALSRCSYQRVGKRCQMGQWYVHQAQLCAVGECWEGARHRQIIAVPCWGEDSAAVPAAGLGDSADSTAWRLSLAFGPKHPTAFDAIPRSVGNGSDRPRVPWTTVYPPTSGSPMALQISHLKTFEERLLQVLVSSF